MVRDGSERNRVADATDPTAIDNARIMAAGSYTAPSGVAVPLRACVDAARSASVLRRQDELAARALAIDPGRTKRVEVTSERSGAACARLAAEGLRVAVLNFANPVVPGGGYLRGARAQEEALCRCSSLYECLCAPQVEAYYEESVAFDGALALDHVIVSPRVPFHRDESLSLLEQPFFADVLTCAAPCLGWMIARETGGSAMVSELAPVFARRCLAIVAAAHDTGADAVVLGAFGCGAFGNDPVLVAGAFAAALERIALPRVVFAVWTSSSETANYDAFAGRFSTW